jgi:hypothetical protein
VTSAFHAGAVAVPGLGGILLPGPERAGKSVLTLGLVLGGCHYLAEDAAVLRHDTLMLEPSGRRISVREEARRLFPEVEEHWIALPPDPADPFAQVAFTRPERLGSRIADPAPVRIVVFPSFSDEGPSAHLSPLARGEAVLELLRHAIGPAADVNRLLDVTLAMLAGAEAYTLRYRDAHAACERILFLARASCRPAAAERMPCSTRNIA